METSAAVATQDEKQGHEFGIGSLLRRNLNFFRIHVLVFTFTPLIFSGIFYASNGRYRVSYVDSLFNCVSAMTVCGLATVDLSGLTPWQQVILFIQMCLGSPVLVSWVIVCTRKYYFAKKFQHYASRRLGVTPVSEVSEAKGWKRVVPFLTPRKLSRVEEKDSPQALSNVVKTGAAQRLTPEMITRTNESPRLVDPTGRVSDPHLPSSRRLSNASSSSDARTRQRNYEVSIRKFATVHGDGPASHAHKTQQLSRFSTDPSATTRPTRSRQDVPSLAVNSQPRLSGGIGPRTQAIEFAPRSIPRRRRAPSSIAEHTHGVVHNQSQAQSDQKSRRQSSTYTIPARSHASPPPLGSGPMYRGFGGFPMPFEILGSVANRFFPTLSRRLTSTVTMPRTTSLVPGHAHVPAGAKAAPYISFDAIVGRNSTFYRITSEQRDELGGIEYRALNALLWIVGAYHIGIQLISFVIIAPYISQSRWALDFLPPQELRPVNPVWFSAFQVVSAYTNGGTSLVDQSMVPFQTAYPMIVTMIFLILAGNTCFPIFLRFLIWIISKCVPKQSRTNETLKFLLDHPRRCFIYLFPSHQTWFLLTMVLFLNFTDWFFFLILDIGNAAFAQISYGIRVVIGLLQASAVRAAGFSIVPISELAPAVKVLYTITMYISIYPIALSVRSTNVYEERSLGIFEDEDEPQEGEFNPQGSKITVWGKYLAQHARRQLAFDMWWLALALFLICIIEQGGLINPENATWFNIFNILFEIVSAYGTVGLSTGLPFANYSLSGAFCPLSKLIVCLVMIRGRHRGLPVAIDRAVLLPSEFKERSDGSIAENDEESTGNGIRAPEHRPHSHDASPSVVQSPEDTGGDDGRSSRGSEERRGLEQDATE